MNPAMSPGEQTLFKKYLNNATNYFEFGMGGSTVWANTTPNIVKITCVESSAEWLTRVVNHCKSNKITTHHIDYPVGDLGHPLNELKKLDITEKEKDLWESYSKAINKTNELYDLVLVDGRFRVACALSAYTNVHPKGFLVVHDYANRAQYHVIEEFFSKVEEVDNLVVLQKKQNKEDSIAAMYERYKYVTS